MIAIVDYRAGNLTSVQLAFAALGIPAGVTAQPAAILAAERVVFPGVGAARAAMEHLTGLGLAAVLRQVVAQGTPFLGICLGTQIVFSRSEEDGGVACLDLLPGKVRRFQPPDATTKVPQIGWNSVVWRRPHPVLEGLAAGSEFYFVHSYFPAPDAPELVLGETEYAGVSFASVVGRANLIATQFHPEKSGRLGLRLLQNFSRWNGRDDGRGIGN